MNRYIGQVIQDGRWVGFGIEAENIYEAEDFVKTVPTEGGRCTCLALTYDETEMVRQAELDR